MPLTRLDAERATDVFKDWVAAIADGRQSDARALHRQLTARGFSVLWRERESTRDRGPTPVADFARAFGAVRDGDARRERRALEALAGEDITVIFGPQQRVKGGAHR